MEIITPYREILTRDPLKKVPIEEIQRSLGLYFNLHSPEKSVNKKVHEKVTEFIRKIVTRRLTSQEIIRALYHIQIPSILYILHGHNATGETLEHE